MKIYALIPARSGSRGLKDKNIKKINNKPLLAYSIKFAKKLDYVSRIFCSTDSKRYQKIAIEYGAEVPFLRSKSASGHLAMENDILKDLRKKFIKHQIEEPDFLVWLRPTFIFRNVNDVEKCIKLLIKNKKASASRIIVPAENRLYVKKGEYILPEFDNKNRSMIRRQDMVSSYKVFNTDVIRFKKNKFSDSFLGANVLGVTSDAICGLDIDNDTDFLIVKSLIENNKKKLNEYI